MKGVWAWALLGAVTLLGGCALAPGQHMDIRSSDSDQSGDHGRVKLVPITPKLIAMDQATRKPYAIPPALLQYHPPTYRIGAGDALFITVWDHPELTAPSGSQQQIYANGRQVQADGTLFYPYVGKIKTAGLTLGQLRDTITQHLKAYIEKPQVDANVITFNSQKVWLSGAFADAGTQPITITPLTLAQAIGKAKIVPNEADLSDLVLTRDGVSYHLDLDALHRSPHGPDDIYLKNGDHIFLPYNDRKQIYLMGEVTRPEALTFKTTDMTLTQALGQVGGLNQTTSKGKAVYVIRGVKNLETQPATVYQLNAKSPSEFILADRFELQPGDVVYVGAAGVTRWNRFLRQVLPLSSIINSAAYTRYNVDRTQ